MNLATVLVGLAVAAVVAAAVAGLVRSRRKGCGCGCAHCANAELCHPDGKKDPAGL